MKIAEACEKLTKLCHEGKAQEELFILSSEQVPDIDEDGSFGYKLQEAFYLARLSAKKARCILGKVRFELLLLTELLRGILLWL